MVLALTPLEKTFAMHSMNTSFHQVTYVQMLDLVSDHGSPYWTNKLGTQIISVNLVYES